MEFSFPEEPVAAGNLPDHWLNDQAHGRVVRFTDRDFDGACNTVDSQRRFPGLTRREIHPMNLREIFLGLAKSNTINAGQAMNAAVLRAEVLRAIRLLLWLLVCHFLRVIAGIAPPGPKRNPD